MELLGGDLKHWQTNVYAPSPKDTQPLWGVFGKVHDVTKPPSVVEFHNYTIDWNEERIVWSVDGKATRTLKASETNINGTLHYPNQPCRIQLGIWDARAPVDEVADEDDDVTPAEDQEGGKYYRLQMHWPASSF